MSAPLPESRGGISSVDISGREATLVFLLYLNRSGSTYLASLLSERPGVVVTLESEAIGRLMLSDRSIFSREQREDCLQKLFDEPKFMQWGIEPERLRCAVAEAPMPLSRERLLRIVLSLLPGGDVARCFVIKSPRMLESINSADSPVRNCKFLHIYRDPRAVYASQRRAISSRTGRPMVRDAVTAGMRWRHAMRMLAHSHSMANSLLELRYEDLVRQTESTLKQVDDFVGLSEPCSDKGTANGADYLARIPGAQRHLHDNVGKAADVSRIDSWQDELAAGDAWLLERACYQELRRHGYPTQKQLGIKIGLIEQIKACGRHLVLWLKDTVRRLTFRLLPQ